jgi:hypothetical protein
MQRACEEWINNGLNTPVLLTPAAEKRTRFRERRAFRRSLALSQLTEAVGLKPIGVYAKDPWRNAPNQTF